jgi:hypothetical protein
VSSTSGVEKFRNSGRVFDPSDMLPSKAISP